MLHTPVVADQCRQRLSVHGQAGYIVAHGAPPSTGSVAIPCAPEPSCAGPATRHGVGIPFSYVPPCPSPPAVRTVSGCSNAMKFLVLLHRNQPESPGLWHWTRRQDGRSWAPRVHGSVGGHSSHCLNSSGRIFRSASGSIPYTSCVRSIWVSTRTRCRRPPRLFLNPLFCCAP